MPKSFDIAVAGGGLGGAALAKNMAQHGAKVLVVEREVKFKDRVRGEILVPWGHAEARALGIDGCLRGAYGNEIHWMDVYAVRDRMVHREIAPTTPQQLPCLAFYHPVMQESLLAAAETAGATVRRGFTVQEVIPGTEPSIVVQGNGHAETISARLVVGAEGRSSVVRSSARFPISRDTDDMMIAGVLLENMPVADDIGELIYHFGLGHFVGVFPQGAGRVRTYLSYHADTQPRFQGHGDLARFIERCQTSGANPAYFKEARAIGPLATFEAAHTWVEYPYRDGVALLGDSATSSDPSWGQGLSLTLRDARVLRDALLSTSDWNAAGHSYAAEHGAYSTRLHQFNQWFGEFYLATGPDADARRARAFPLIAEDPSRQPDHVFAGPDSSTDESVRKRFFGVA